MLLETLESERDMLKKRLLRANVIKLDQSKPEPIENDPMHNQEKDIYLWNSGIISSTTALTKLMSSELDA